jgi:hypothetical protein
VFGELYYANITANPGYEFDNFIVSSVKREWYRQVDTISDHLYTDNRHGAWMDSVRMLYR